MSSPPPLDSAAGTPAGPAPAAAATTDATTTGTASDTTTNTAADASLARFTLTRAIEFVALAMLLGAIARALHAFTGWWLALLFGIALTYSFSQLTHIAMGHSHSRWPRRVLAGVFALVLACITSSLTYSSIYATTAAGESARRDYEAKRERTQHELQRLVTTAESAQKAMEDWAANAQSKSETEARGGNTCPGRESKDKPGPISTWRADDAQVARTLAAQLQQHAQAARRAAIDVLALSEPEGFAQVKEGYAVLNRAVESTVPLTKGGWAGPTLATLGDRKSSQIVYPNGVVVSCGDGARLSLIDATVRQLKQLDDAAPLARLSPVIDLSQPQEVTTRGLVRGMNLLAYMLSYGHLGQFKDDALMADALKQGAFTRETASFGLAILAELGVVFTAMLRREAGAAPFQLSLPGWVQAQRRRPPQPGRLQAVLRAGATLLSNLFYAQPQAPESPLAASRAVGATSAAASAAGPESSQFGLVTLADDPHFRARETEWARELLPHHHSWGDEQDYLLLPRLTETRAARKIARSLAAHDLLRCQSAQATWRELARTPFEMDLRAQLGDRCEQLTYEVYAVRSDYAQTLRLVLIDGAVPLQVALPQPVLVPPPAAVASAQAGGPGLRPLRHKLLARQRGWPPF